MSAPAMLPVSAKPAGPAFRRALQDALQRVSWRAVGLVFLIMLALDTWLVFELAQEFDPVTPRAEAYLSGAIVNLFMAFSIMVTTFVADAQVTRGARRLPAYGYAVAIGSAAGALTQWAAHVLLDLRPRYEVIGIPHLGLPLQAALTFFEYLIWGSIIVFVYVNRRDALRATARMNAAQIHRADTQRRTLESRLQALQARVEPQFLLNTLAQVHALYESDPAKGSQMLGDLIVYLRAALPQLRDSTSTLEQELKLVGAYLSIMRLHSGRRLEFDIDASRSELAARVPPMVLLPLVNHLLTDGLEASTAGSTVRIAARAGVETLCTELSARNRYLVSGGSSDTLRDIRERLHALYGTRGALGCESSTSLGTRIVMEIPYEPTHGGHR